MFSKITTRFCLILGASLIVAGVAITVLDSAADASTGTRSCEFQSAKNVTVFPAGTTFTIRQPFKTFTYTCDGDSSRWDETIYSMPVPGHVVGGNAGVLSNDDTSPPNNGGTTTGGGGVLQ